MTYFVHDDVLAHWVVLHDGDGGGDDGDDDGDDGDDLILKKRRGICQKPLPLKMKPRPLDYYKDRSCIVRKGGH